MDLAISQDVVLKEFVNKFSMHDARVLEVGGSVSLERLDRCGAIPAHWLSIDPTNQSYKNNFYQSLIGVCSNIESPSGYFDFVFSSNAFEHINEFGASMKELFRVLNSGGIGYAHFGPIWSGPDGHHLETTVDGNSYCFWETPIIPAWAHLLLKEHELAEILSVKVPHSTANYLAQYVFNTSEQNRVMHRDFFSILSGVGFEIIEQVDIEEIDYQYDLSEEIHIDGRILNSVESKLKALASKYGENHNYLARDLLIVFRKP
jgi:SAM-dependent methyltransferase